MKFNLALGLEMVAGTKDLQCQIRMREDGVEIAIERAVSGESLMVHRSQGRRRWTPPPSGV